MSVESVLIRNFVDLTLTRNAVSLVGGYKVETPTVSTISGVIQPMSPKELLNVDEGQRTKIWLNIWTRAQLKARDVLTDPEGQEVTVQKVDFWREGSFYKCEGTRVDHDAAG